MKIGVLVPAYRRPDDLKRCLLALARQQRRADEVVVVARTDDTATWTVLAGAEWSPLPLRTVAVGEAGVIHAMNEGLSATSSDVIAITDDDAAPRPDWLARMEEHFESNPQVGGVGGRDWLHGVNAVQDSERSVVGKLQWFGRVIGNHHVGVGGPRDVDILKGVNCAYRAEILRKFRFDTRLHGRGAQLHWEISLGLALRRAGWRLVYDPAVVVDHYPAERHDADARNLYDHSGSEALANAVHNETLILLEHLPPARRAVYLLWAWSIGTRASPGLAQWLRLWLVERHLATIKWRAAARGRVEGWRTWRRDHASRDAKRSPIDR